MFNYFNLKACNVKSFQNKLAFNKFKNNILNCKNNERKSGKRK